MWIQIRTMDGKETRTVDSLSRLTKVQELRKKIAEMFHVEPQLQRLFYRGKQVKWLSIHPLIFVPGNLPPPPCWLLQMLGGRVNKGWFLCCKTFYLFSYPLKSSKSFFLRKKLEVANRGLQGVAD